MIRFAVQLTGCAAGSLVVLLATLAALIKWGNYRNLKEAKRDRAKWDAITWGEIDDWAEENDVPIGANPTEWWLSTVLGEASQ